MIRRNMHLKKNVKSMTGNQSPPFLVYDNNKNDNSKQ